MDAGLLVTFQLLLDGAAFPDGRGPSRKRCCYVCAAPAPLRSEKHPDCPHFACSLWHLLDMEMKWVGLKEEARELDAAWARIPVLPPRAAATDSPQ